MNNVAQVETGSIEYRVVGQGRAVLVLNGGTQTATLHWDTSCFS